MFFKRIGVLKFAMCSLSPSNWLAEVLQMFDSKRVLQIHPSDQLAFFNVQFAACIKRSSMINSQCALQEVSMSVEREMYTRLTRSMLGFVF